MDSINEVRSMTARTTSESQMENPNSTNIAGFHQSGTICPGMPLLSSKNVDSINEVRTKTARPPPQITRSAIEPAQTWQDIANRT